MNLAGGKDGEEAELELGVGIDTVFRLCNGEVGRCRLDATVLAELSALYKGEGCDRRSGGGRWLRSSSESSAIISKPPSYNERGMVEAV